MQPDCRIIRVIKDRMEEVWLDRSDYEQFFSDVGAPNPPAEHLQYIKKNNGELLVYLKTDSEVLGWLGLIPSSTSAELAGIGTNRKYRNMGVATELLNFAELYLQDRGISILQFQTSPLLTANSLLYLRQSSTDYLYNDSIFVGRDNNIPWPVVDCSMRLPRVRNEAREKIRENLQSVISWTDYAARIEDKILFEISEYKLLSLPELNIQDILAEMKNDNVDFLFKVSDAFKELKRMDFRIVGYDKILGKYSYIMKKNDLTMIST